MLQEIRKYAVLMALCTACAAVDASAATITINGNAGKIARATKNDDVVINGNKNVVTLTGPCKSLTVNGNDNKATVDVAGEISVFGSDNIVVYRQGQPKISNFGNGNAIVRAPRKTKPRRK